MLTSASINLDPQRVLKHLNAILAVKGADGFNQSRPAEGTETLAGAMGRRRLLSFNQSRPAEGTETLAQPADAQEHGGFNQSRPAEGTETQ